MTKQNYQPPDKFLWDPWFIKSQDVYHLFHQQCSKSATADTCSFSAVNGHATSQDLVRWETCKDPLQLGTSGAWDDQAMWTGCTFEHEGKFYLYYTGRSTDPFWYQQIGLAISDDLYEWKRFNGDGLLLSPDGKIYSDRKNMNHLDFPPAWRDPFVFQYNAKFYMAITAEDQSLPQPYNACVGLAESDDLINWNLLTPILSPNRYAQMEVPQLIFYEGYWYLFFSAKEECFCPKWADQVGRHYGWRCYYSKDLYGGFMPVNTTAAVIEGEKTIFNMRLIEQLDEGFLAIGWDCMNAAGEMIYALSDRYKVVLAGDKVIASRL